MLEVSGSYAPALPADVGPAFLSFAVEPGAVEAIAARLGGWLSLPEPERESGAERW